MNKKKKGLIFALVSVMVCLMSCDDGLIQEKESSAEHTGYTVKLTGRIAGVNTWGSNFNLVLAAFSESSEYAIVQQRIPQTAANGTVLTIYDVDASAKTVELCVTDILRRRVLTIESMEITTEADPRDTVTIDVGDINASMFSAIQKGVFNTRCAQCHGGSNTAAADLYLTEGKAHASLVNVPSTRVADGIRVIPGDSAASVLHKVLYPGNAAGLSFSHAGMVSDEDDENVLELIDSWIENGATE